LDAGVHPMTGYEGRITTNYTHGWWDAVSSTIHEYGHSAYQMNLSKQHRGLPLGEDLSTAVHESQSRFWENHVGKSKEFCEFLFNSPMLKTRIYKSSYNDTVEQFYRSINKVEPSLIRIQADELTYNLHVILRFELEQEMFAGMDLASLPRRWNDKMEEYLGIKPVRDSDGVLQDVHWSAGLLGYFPTYILGSMISAQLATAMKKDIPDFYKLIEQGNFKEHREWLTEKIHKYGRRYNTKELIRNATGKDPDCEDYIRYLKDKFGKLYDL
jgi:carboxypeptidase Taq